MGAMGRVEREEGSGADHAVLAVQEFAEGAVGSVTACIMSNSSKALSLMRCRSFHDMSAVFVVGACIMMAELIESSRLLLLEQ